MFYTYVLISKKDGKFYAIQAYSGIVDVIDPATMQILNSVYLELTNDPRGVAVNNLGEIYSVTWNGELSKHDSTGLRLNVTPAGIGNLIDIDPTQVTMEIIGRRVKMGHKVFPGDKYSGGDAARPLFSFETCQ